MHRRITWLLKPSTAEETRKVTAYMKAVIEKKRIKGRKRNIKHAINCIEGDIARSALLGISACTFDYFDPEIVNEVIEHFTALGYKATFARDDELSINSLFISWSDEQNAD